MDGEEFKTAVEHLSNVYSRMYCTYQADRARSLFPMIFNTPCEDQAELEGLVRFVAQQRQADDASHRVKSRSTIDRLNLLLQLQMDILSDSEASLHPSPKKSIGRTKMD